MALTSIIFITQPSKLRIVGVKIGEFRMERWTHDELGMVYMNEEWLDEHNIIERL